MIGWGARGAFSRGNASGRLRRGAQAALLLGTLGLGNGCGSTTSGTTSQGAGGGSGATGGTATAGASSSGGASGAQAFVVHEWGTFTSMISAQGSLKQGGELPGMHHEDEALPSFVIGRSPGLDFGKAMESLPGPVTQKMETPVLYFYSDQALKVDVDVTFKDGIISQWYPDATSFWPAVGEATAFSGGNMRWQVQLAPGDTEAPIPVAEDDIWAPSRNVASVPVRAAGAIEQFIFYRGLGDFSVPLSYEVDFDSVSVKNNSAQRIPAAFYLNLHDGGGLVAALGSIDPGGSVVAQGGPKERDLDAYVLNAKDLVKRALVDSGLYEDEAQAMVDTWAKSYFLTPGRRLLYVLPREWTDALLPIQIAPAPDQLVRTLVGRVELLTGDRETELMGKLHQAFTGGGTLDTGALGRFAEPQLQRALQLDSDPGFQSWVSDQILQLNVQTGAQ
ncbi:MAG: hypothetical protein KC492_43365 [Myxococcales bacterium]|nr:hypothetical protein [Myxococcales bacterium]